mmetsp:Transcript_23067/g.80407  ORF Transcript_23067/g.80407 Transcript_23067/m.80407 type:complete len:501 (-) Transcript_23067:230-1732(-)
MPRKGARAGTGGGAAVGGAGTGGSSGGAGREDLKHLEERVLQGIYHLYTSPSKASGVFKDMFGDGTEVPGIEGIAREVGRRQLLHPSRKITVMIVGNHSAGKSSFVNWYTGEDGLLSTGMAVTTQGFTICTSGDRKDTIQGEPALQLKPHFRGLTKYEGVMQRFFVQVSTSRAKDFSNVDLIDSPGLLDADSSGGGYPFDVNEIILHMARHVDMVLIFMDPHGQATGQRTMRVVRDLDKAGMSDKTHFFLTKADEFTEAKDLTKTIAQTAAALAKHLDTQHGMEVKTMWIPGLHRGRDGEGAASAEHNQIGSLVAEIAAAVRRKVQSNMTMAKADCDAVAADIDAELEEQERRRAIRSRWFRQQLLLGVLVLPVLLSLSFLDLIKAYEHKLPTAVTASPVFAAVQPHLADDQPFGYFIDLLALAGLATVWSRVGAAAVAFLFFEACRQFLAWRARRLPVRDAAGLKRLAEYRDVLGTMKKVVHGYTTDYVEHAQAPEFKP